MCVCVWGSQGCLHALTLFCATSAVSPVRCNPHTGVVVHAKKSFCGHTVQKLVHRCKYQMDRAMSFLHFNGMFVFLLLVCKFAHNCTSRGLDVCMLVCVCPSVKPSVSLMDGFFHWKAKC